jgi:tetratricopeptide (TPR) repeat protein
MRTISLRMLMMGASLLWGARAGVCGGSSEAIDRWVEVRSAHFVVASNAGETEARRIAFEFERVRGIFHAAFPKFRVDPAQPIVILAARDEATMKMLAPDEWQGDGHVRPSGLFHSDGEKDYVVLRLDAEGTTAFHTIYHEYTHALLFLNFKHLPLWVSEGVAEFFGNSMVGERDVRTGTADKGHLFLLSKNQWLPIDGLLGATQESPFYNERNPASIFYAESWAVTHYLLADPGARREQLLGKYLAAWGRSGDPVAAGREAFGDLPQFGERIKKYVRSADWRAGMVLPSQADAKTDATANATTAAEGGNFAERDLSAGEILAYRGDFLVHRGQLEAAEPLLSESVKEDGRSAETHDALGLFEYRSNNYEEAEEEFAKAIAAGSREFMTFYCHGVLQLRSLAANEDATHQAVAALERAAKLNPRYAPTFEALTQAYSRASGTQAKALEAAKTAVELEPESRTYRFGLAYVLLNNGHAPEAGQVAEKLLASAATEEDTSAAKKLIATIDEEKEWEKESAEDSELGAGKESASTGMDGSAAGTAASGKVGAGSASSRPATARRQLPAPEWMALDGEIVAVECGRGNEVTITLTMPKGPMGFHAADFRRVGVSGPSEGAVPTLQSCRAWKGRRVKIWFRWVQGQDWVGEITKVYFF